MNLVLRLTQKNKNKYYVEFRDSYLLLTTSLDNLSKTFSINNKKMEYKLPFPYRFVNEPDVSYNYIGPFPEFKFYDKINKKDYDNLISAWKLKGNLKWDLKKETIKYCEQDCKALYYAIKEFSKIIYLQFRLDISNTPTISSLAFRIYRVLFLQEEKKIPILNGLAYDFIYQGYYGGAVDAYIPFGKNIKSYDVNSLYPSSMFNNPMPVGNPYYFEGDISYFDKINFNYPTDSELNGDKNSNIKPKTIFSCLNEIFNDENPVEFKNKIKSFLNLDNKNKVLSNENNLPFGFFEVDIKTPPKDTWNQPILLKKHNIGNGGIRTIAPVGNWKGVYFSQELYNAIDKNPNHKFKTHRGFLFRQGNLFKDYVDTLFNLRINNPKDSPLNIISKLLLNSLYGRFGMSPDKPNHVILNDRIKKDKIFIDNDILNITDLGKGNELYSYVSNKENLETFNDKKGKYSNLFINVSIAAAITGYSRIFMSYYKNNPLIKIYYSDTDSIFTDIDLSTIYPELVGKGLGQLKPEYDFKEACFLAPKVYGGITQIGESIVKAKGVKNIIPYDDLKTLLQKENTLQIPNEKWYRNISEGNIQIKQEIYNLAINSTKRELIYDNKGVLVDTKPIIISGDDY